MSETTINQRLKFLIDALGMKVGAFSRELGVSETSTRNYTDRSSKPGFDYLEKVGSHFKQVNLTWLITGEGEPLLTPPTENTVPTVNAKKIFRSPIVGTNHGGVNQQDSTSNADNDLKAQLTLAQQEIENLRGQLARADALVAAKDETISLLRGSYRNPN